MPWQIEQAVQALRQRLNDYNREHSQEPPVVVTLGIHCHNDCGMAVANSLMAIQAGVGLVQGTMNGIGERTGNADLCSIIPTLALKLSSTMTCRDQLSQITPLSRWVDEILNLTPHRAAPYVGASAFAHKGGLHVAALSRSPESYQHADPADVGNECRVLISELSGRQNILRKVEDLMKQGRISSSSSTSSSSSSQEQQQQQQPEALAVPLANHRAGAILNRVKQLEAKGYTFEGAEASVDLMILHASQEYCPPFQVLDYSAQVYDSHLDSASRFLSPSSTSSSLTDGNDNNPSLGRWGPTARATVKVRTIETRRHGRNQNKDVNNNDRNDNDDNDEEEDWFEPVVHDRLEVGDGNGPVDALAKALMRALQPVHPSLTNVELMDYKVRILDPEQTTGAATRVMISFQDVAHEKTWTTVSVDTNIISASLNALIDGLEYALLDHSSGIAAADHCLLLPPPRTTTFS